METLEIAHHGFVEASDGAGHRTAHMATLEIESGHELQCWFNPKEYTITKTSTFNAKAASGQDLPPVQYGGGQPAS